MSVRSVLDAGREAHLALLVDTCDVKRQTGTSLNADDKQVPVYATIYTGEPCRVKPFHSSSDSETGEVSVVRRGYEIDLRWDAPTPLQRGDVLTVTVSDDTWVIGKPLTVTEVDYSGTVTVRRVMVEDRT